MHTVPGQRHVPRPVPWKWSLNSDGRLRCAVAGCRAAGGLVLMFCSSPQGSGRVQGCSSVTGPVYRRYMQVPAHSKVTCTHTLPHVNPSLACLHAWRGQLTVSEHCDASWDDSYLGKTGCLVFLWACSLFEAQKRMHKKLRRESCCECTSQNIWKSLY